MRQLIKPVERFISGCDRPRTQTVNGADCQRRGVIRANQLPRRVTTTQTTRVGRWRRTRRKQPGGTGSNIGGSLTHMRDDGRAPRQHMREDSHAPSLGSFTFLFRRQPFTPFVLDGPSRWVVRLTALTPSDAPTPTSPGPDVNSLMVSVVPFL